MSSAIKCWSSTIYKGYQDTQRTFDIVLVEHELAIIYYDAVYLLLLTDY